MLILNVRAGAPQAMARRSDGPWILKGQSNNYGNTSFGGNNTNYARASGDVFDMKGCAACVLMPTAQHITNCFQARGCPVQYPRHHC